MKFNRINTTLIFLIAYVTLLPRISILSENSVYITLAVTGSLALISLSWNKYWIDTTIFTILFVILALAKLRYAEVEDNILLLRVASVSAFFFLSFTLLIGPLSRFTKFFLHFYKHRRHIGVATFFLALLHAEIVFVKIFDSNIQNLMSVSYIFFGMTSIYIMIFMAGTSWDYIQKHVKLSWWSILHGVAFALYFGLVYNFFVNAAEFAPTIQKISPIVFMVIWILVAPWALPKYVLPVVNGWKQLHVLVYIANLSLIIHAWYAAISYQNELIKYSFLAVAGSVITIHAIGWVKMILDWINITRYMPVNIDGENYYKVATTESFIEGIGQKFVINKVPVAIFKYQEKFVAFSNICAHQGGPIYQGKIVNGYVECPWHNWQYSIDNGCGPKGFSDCIPYFPTLVKDNQVYVSLKRIRNK